MKSFVPRDAAAKEDLYVVEVRHGAFRDFRQHGERDLLNREGKVPHRSPLLPEGEGRGEHAAERDVHTLHAVRQREQGPPVAREPLEDRTARERKAALPRELVEHVADPDVERLPEHPIPPSGEGDDLGVPAAYVQQDGVLRGGDAAADLQMGDTMIHPDDRSIEGDREGPCRDRDGPKARAEAGTLRERDEIEVPEVNPCDVRGLSNQRDDRLRVMIRRLPRMDAARLGPHHVVYVREDAARLVDDPDADRVGGPFDPEGEQWNR